MNQVYWLELRSWVYKGIERGEESANHGKKKYVLKEHTGQWDMYMQIHKRYIKYDVNVYKSNKQYKAIFQSSHDYILNVTKTESSYTNKISNKS